MVRFSHAAGRYGDAQVGSRSKFRALGFLDAPGPHTDLIDHLPMLVAFLLNPQLSSYPRHDRGRCHRYTVAMPGLAVGAAVGAGISSSKYSAQTAGREQTCRFCMCLAVGRQSVAARHVALKLIDIGQHLAGIFQL